MSLGIEEIDGFLLLQINPNAKAVEFVGSALVSVITMDKLGDKKKV